MLVELAEQQLAQVDVLLRRFEDNFISNMGFEIVI